MKCVICVDKYEFIYINFFSQCNKRVLCSKNEASYQVFFKSTLVINEVSLVLLKYCAEINYALIIKIVYVPYLVAQAQICQYIFYLLAVTYLRGGWGVPKMVM